MKKILLTAFVIMFSALNIYSEDLGIAIPDTNLRNYITYKLGLERTSLIYKEYAKNLTDMQCNNMQISSLVGLGEFKNLEFISFSSNRIDDISEITKLPNLTFADFSNNNIDSIQCLANLITERLSIKLSNNCIQDFTINNMIADIEIIGENEQYQNCIRTATNIERFKVYGIDLTTRKFEFDIMAWSTETQVAVLSYGDTFTKNLTTYGQSILDTHSYSGINNYNITLTINNQSKSYSIGDLFEKPVLIKPIKSEEVLTRNTNFNISFSKAISGIEIEIYDSNNVLVQHNSLNTVDKSININLNFLHNSIYKWRARILTEAGGSFWSDYENFILNIPPHSIYLTSGWNLISSNMIPQLPDSMQHVTSYITNNLIIAKNNNGEVYIPSYDINNIGRWNKTQGYQVYMSKADTLNIYGDLVNPTETSITLSSGWNMISYLRNSELDCETAFASLAEGNLIIVKDNFGNVYIPEYGINTIGNLIPGQGYQIYVLNADVLIYSGN
jgi:hypothetical protein